MNSNDILIYMIATLTEYLGELSDIRDTPTTQFAFGQKTAYTECLEMLQLWEKSGEYGLNFNIEHRYPL